LTIIDRKENVNQTIEADELGIEAHVLVKAIFKFNLAVFLYCPNYPQVQQEANDASDGY
jgi:hypothetical protein